MWVDPKLDVQLVRAIREGVGALPADLERLRSYVTLIEHLLEEKARELEPSWEAACDTAAEIETLHALEDTVTERAIGIEASTLTGIRAKLAIWKVLVLHAEDELDALRNQLILSIGADLDRMAAQSPLGA